MIGSTTNNQLNEIIEKLGGNPDELEDNLFTTKIDKIIELKGRDAAALEDNLLDTKLMAIINLLGGSASELMDNLRSTKLKCILRLLGGDPATVPDNLTSSILAAIIDLVHAYVEKTASGRSFVIDDVATEELKQLVFYGESTQDGTPTPAAPVEIVDLVNPTVTIKGDVPVDYADYLAPNNATVVSKNKIRINPTSGNLILNSMPLRAGNKYKLTFTIPSDVSTWTSGNILIKYNGSTLSEVNVKTYVGKSVTRTVTASSNTDTLRLEIWNAKSTTDLTIGFEIIAEDVQTIDTKSKNLFDLSKAEKDKSLSTKNQGQTEYNLGWYTIDYLPVELNDTYVRSSRGVSVGNQYFMYDANKEFIGSDVGNPFTITNSNCAYIRISINGNTTDISTYQIEKGYTITDYEPYMPPITLRSIGSVKDTLTIRSDGTGELVQRVGSMDLGDLNWQYNSTLATPSFITPRKNLPKERNTIWIF